MGSKSNSAQPISDQQTNVVVDRDTVMRDGQMISGSLIIDQSDEVMKALANNFKATWQVMTASNKVATQDMYQFGRSVLEAADRNQLRMSEFGYRTLQEGVNFLRESIDAGKYVVDFAGVVADRSFDLADRVANDQSDTVDKALGLLADTKTGDFSETLKSVTFTIMLFALGAIYLARKRA